MSEMGDLGDADRERACGESHIPGVSQARYEISQHVGWLKTYVDAMNEHNWRDMKLQCERQLAELSKDLKTI